LSVSAAALILMGLLPSRRLGGTAGFEAMLAGCGVSLLASLIGALPVVRSEPGHSAQNIPTFMGAMLLRLAAVVFLTFVAAMQGIFALKPLILWVGISYVAFLPADSYITLRAVRATDDPED